MRNVTSADLRFAVRVDERLEAARRFDPSRFIYARHAASSCHSPGSTSSPRYEGICWGTIKKLRQHVFQILKCFWFGRIIHAWVHTAFQRNGERPLAGAVLRISRQRYERGFAPPSTRHVPPEEFPTDIAWIGGLENSMQLYFACPAPKRCAQGLFMASQNGIQESSTRNYGQGSDAARTACLPRRGLDGKSFGAEQSARRLESSPRGLESLTRGLEQNFLELEGKSRGFFGPAPAVWRAKILLFQLCVNGLRRFWPLMTVRRRFRPGFRAGRRASHPAGRAWAGWRR